MGRRSVSSSETIASGRRDGVLAWVRRLGVWGAIAALLVLAGSVGTVLAARSVSRTDAEKSRQEFRQATGQITSTIRLVIAQETDLANSVAVFKLQNPHASNADFKRWASEAGVFARHPELSGIASIAFVPRSELRAFENRAKADPAGRLGPGGTFAITPAGVRPYYCFIALVENRNGSSQTPAGVDYCASTSQLIASRASGQGYGNVLKLPYVSKSPLFNIETPLYRGGGVPPTVAKRRAAFLGWTGIVILPRLLLDSALQNHPGVAVALHYTSGSRGSPSPQGTPLAEPAG